MDIIPNNNTIQTNYGSLPLPEENIDSQNKDGRELHRMLETEGIPGSDRTGPVCPQEDHPEATPELRCTSPNPKAIRAAKAFPGRLQEVHQGRIVLRSGAVYQRSQSHIDVACAVCGHRWGARPDRLVNAGDGCPECHRLRNISLAGIRRNRPATKAERDKAAELRAEGWTYAAIGEELGRAESAARRWLNPEQAEKNRQASYKRWTDNPEKMKSNRKVYRQTPHGKLGMAVQGSTRRHENEAEWITLSANEQQQYISLYQCRNILNDEAGYIKYHIDHIYPLVKGGANAPYNLRLMLAEDNLSKGKKVRPEDWNFYVGRVADMFMNPWMYDWGNNDA